MKPTLYLSFVLETCYTHIQRDMRFYKTRPPMDVTQDDDL